MVNYVCTKTVPDSTKLHLIKGPKSKFVGGGWGPSARRRDAPDTSGRLMSFSVEGEGGGCFREVAGVSIVDVGSLCSTL